VLDAKGNKCVSSTSIPADPGAFSALVSEGECFARSVEVRRKRKIKKQTENCVIQTKPPESQILEVFLFPRFPHLIGNEESRYREEQGHGNYGNVTLKKKVDVCLKG